MENAKLLIFESDNLSLRGSSLNYIITEVWQTITIWEKMQNCLILKGPSDLAWVFGSNIIVIITEVVVW